MVMKAHLKINEDELKKAIDEIDPSTFDYSIQEQLIFASGYRNQFNEVIKKIGKAGVDKIKVDL
jgi:hypothetical protein